MSVPATPWSCPPSSSSWTPCPPLTNAAMFSCLLTQRKRRGLLRCEDRTAEQDPSVGWAGLGWKEGGTHVPSRTPPPGHLVLQIGGGDQASSLVSEHYAGCPPAPPGPHTPSLFPSPAALGRCLPHGPPRCQLAPRQALSPSLSPSPPSKHPNLGFNVYFLIRMPARRAPPWWEQWGWPGLCLPTGPSNFTPGRGAQSPRACAPESLFLFISFALWPPAYTHLPTQGIIFIFGVQLFLPEKNLGKRFEIQT